MKKKTLFTLLLSSLSLFALFLSVPSKVTYETKAEGVPNPTNYTQGHIRIMVVPDINAKTDNWNANSANTGIVILDNVLNKISAESQDIDFANDSTKKLIVHDRQFRPSSGFHNGLKLHYFNVLHSDISGKYIQVVRYNSTKINGESYHHNVMHVTDAKLYKDENIRKIWKIEKNADGEYASFWESTSNANTFTGQVIAYIIEGYLTCSSSSLNGYMAYSELQSIYNIDSRLTSDIKVPDFPNIASYVDGRTSNNQVLINLGEKVTKMKALYEAATPSGTNATNKETNIM